MTTGAIGIAMLQSNRHPPTYQHPTFYRPDALPVAEGKSRTFRGLLTPNSPGVFRPCLDR